MIADVTLYQDTGYMRGGHHVCRRGSVPAAASGTTTAVFQNVKISFSDVNTADLIIPYIDAIGYTYIAIDCDDGALYGWITDIKLISTKTIEVCRISWQWDYWRTFGHRAVLGSGRLTRCATDPGRPDNVMRGFYQTALYEYNIENLMDGPYTTDQKNGVYRTSNWTVLQYISKTEVSGTTITEIKTICWPCTYVTAMCDTLGTTRSQGTTRLDSYAGLIEERLNIDPEDILGAWVCPFCPYPTAFNVTEIQGQYYWQPQSINTADITEVGPSGSSFAYFTLKNAESVSIPASNSFTVPSEARRNHVDRTVCMADFNGNLIWSLPHGLNLSTIGYVGFSFSPLSGQMIISFRQDDIAAQNYNKAAAEGLIVNIMLPQLPISSNTWQSYVLSGQRDYEIESAKAQQKAAYVKGLTNTGIGAVEGAIAGSMTAPGIGTIAGAAIGQLSSIISSTINAQTEEDLREKVQALRDTAVANQSQTMLIPGQSSYWIQSGEEPKIILMLAQDNGEYFAYIGEYGYNDDTAYESCDALIPTTQAVGPIQIEKLDVTGPIPAAARLQIRDMFAKGVYIE